MHVKGKVLNEMWLLMIQLLTLKSLKTRKDFLRNIFFLLTSAFCRYYARRGVSLGSGPGAHRLCVLDRQFVHGGNFYCIICIII